VWLQARDKNTSFFINMTKLGNTKIEWRILRHNLAKWYYPLLRRLKSWPPYIIERYTQKKERWTRSYVRNFNLIYLQK